MQLIFFKYHISLNEDELMEFQPTLINYKGLKNTSYWTITTALTHLDQSTCTSPDQNTGVGSLSLLQDIFPTQGLNPGLLHCRQILYLLRHQGSPTNHWAKCYRGTVSPKTHNNAKRSYSCTCHITNKKQRGQGFPWGSNGKESTLQCRGWRFNPW